MDFTIPISSLKNMSIIRILKSLWLSSLIIGKSKSGLDLNSLKKSNHFISEKANKLNLPDAIKKDVLRLVKPIGFQIYKWLMEHHKAGTLNFELTRESVDLLTTKIDIIIVNISSCFLTTEIMLPHISLEKMAIIRVTRSLWSSKFLLNEFSQTLDETRWNNIACKVITNAKILPIPSSTKEILITLLQSVNSHIHEWVMDNENFDFEVTYPSLNHLSWTATDTIDRRKTAQTLVKLPSELSKRYKLACLYSLEDLEFLWNQLQPEDFYEKNLAIIEIKESFITFFWSCQKGNDLARLNEVVEAKFPGRTVYEHMTLILAEKVKCLTVFRLYWDVLLTNLKQNNLLIVAQIASENKSAEILIFLLAEMTSQQRESFLNNNTYNILQTFLQWPYQNLFLKVFKLKVEFLSQIQYGIILESAVTSVEYNYEDILVSLWTNSSEMRRRYVLRDDATILQLFRQVVEMGYVELFKLIWNDLDERDLKFVRISHILIQQSDWYFLNYLLPLCLTGDFAIPKYKHYMNDYAKRTRITDPEAIDFEKWNNADRLTLLEHLYDIFKE